MAVSSFNYLGRVIPALENYWPEVIANIRKARKKCAHLFRVLRREGEDARMLGIFYMTMVQVFLIFG